MTILTKHTFKHLPPATRNKVSNNRKNHEAMRLSFSLVNFPTTAWIRYPLWLNLYLDKNRRLTSIVYNHSGLVIALRRKMAQNEISIWSISLQGSSPRATIETWACLSCAPEGIPFYLRQLPVWATLAKTWKNPISFFCARWIEERKLGPRSVVYDSRDETLHLPG